MSERALSSASMNGWFLCLYLLSWRLFLPLASCFRANISMMLAGIGLGWKMFFIPAGILPERIVRVSTILPDAAEKVIFALVFPFQADVNRIFPKNYLVYQDVCFIRLFYQDENWIFPWGLLTWWKLSIFKITIFILLAGRYESYSRKWF